MRLPLTADSECETCGGTGYVVVRFVGLGGPTGRPWVSDATGGGAVECWCVYLSSWHDDESDPNHD